MVGALSVICLPGRTSESPAATAAQTSTIHQRITLKLRSSLRRRHCGTPPLFALNPARDRLGEQRTIERDARRCLLLASIGASSATNTYAEPSRDHPGTVSMQIDIFETIDV